MFVVCRVLSVLTRARTHGNPSTHFPVSTYKIFCNLKSRVVSSTMLLGLVLNYLYISAHSCAIYTLISTDRFLIRFVVSSIRYTTYTCMQMHNHVSLYTSVEAPTALKRGCGPTSRQRYTRYMEIVVTGNDNFVHVYTPYFFQFAKCSSSSV